MSNIIQTAEFIALMSLTFTLALGLEWALLTGILRALAAGLKPQPVRAARPAVSRTERSTRLSQI